jgi:AcrR family transcriptional regulator
VFDSIAKSVIAVSLRARKKRETRQRVIAAAKSLLKEKGYETTTVEDIAEKAQISRMTFFNYFSGKDKLLEALAAEMFAENEAVFEQILASTGTIDEALPRELEERLDLIIRYRSFLAVVVKYTKLFSNFYPHNATPADIDPDQLSQYYQAKLELVSQAQAAGSIRDDIPASEICYAYYALRNDAVGRWLLQENQPGEVLKSNFRMAMAIFLNGLKPAPQS